MVYDGKPYPTSVVRPHDPAPRAAFSQIGGSGACGRNMPIPIQEWASGHLSHEDWTEVRQAAGITSSNDEDMQAPASNLMTCGRRRTGQPTDA